MQIEHLDNHTARLTVEVEQSRLDAAMQKAARRIANRVNIPGFRKGKAPFAVIMQWAGQQAVLEEALDELGNEVYREALRESNLDPYAPGALEDMSTEGGLKLVFTFPKAPEVKLGDYRSLRLDYSLPTVSDEDVERAIEAIREQRAQTETVERPAAMGDVVVGHVYGTVVHPAHEHAHAHGEEAEKAEGEAGGDGEAHDHDHAAEPEVFMDRNVNLLLTEENERDFLPGFSAQLVGVSAGEEREITLSYPDDFAEKPYAGHAYTVKIKVEAVRSRTIPELTDDFAKDVSNGNAQTVDDLRKQVREDLEKTAKRESDDKYVDQLFEKVVEGATFAFPKEMVDAYIDDILAELDNNLRQRGLNLDQLKAIEGKTDETLRKEYEPVAISRIKRSLALRALSEMEGLTVSQAEINAHLDNLAATFSTDPKQIASFRRMLGSEENMRGIGANMLMDRVKQRLIAIGKGENPPVGMPAAELAMPVAENLINFGGAATEGSETPAAETPNTPAESAE